MTIKQTAGRDSLGEFAPEFAHFTRPLAKLSKAIKIADTSNQGEAKRKASSAVTVTIG